MAASITQKNGLTLMIHHDNGLLHVQLSGSLLQAVITADSTPATEYDIALPDFLAKAAHQPIANISEWRSLCQELAITVSTEPEFSGFVLLRVNMGSTSDDECDWQLSATLKVKPQQLIDFAAVLASCTL